MNFISEEENYSELIMPNARNILFKNKVKLLKPNKLYEVFVYDSLIKLDSKF